VLFRPFVFCCRLLNRYDAVIKDFQELRYEFCGTEVNAVALALKNKMRYVDSFAIPIENGYYIYATINWDIFENHSLYVFYVAGNEKEQVKIYEIVPAYKNKEKAARLLNKLTGRGDKSMYEITVIGKTNGVIKIRCKGLYEEDAVEQAAYYLVDAHCDNTGMYGEKATYIENVLTDFYYDSVSKVAPVVPPYSMYLTKLHTLDVEIAIHTKATSKKDALVNAACCLRDCIYDDTAFEIFKNTIQLPRNTTIKEKGLICCEDEKIYINVVSVTKI
jgi:hypothetical protein